MRVLHMVAGLANSSGLTHAILNISRQLVRAGHEVSVFYLTGRGLDTTQSGDDRIVLRGFPLTWSRTWCYSRDLTATLKSEIGDYDVVHVHSLWLHLNLVAWRVCRSAGVPIVVAPHGALDSWCLDYHGVRKRLYGSLVERRILNGVSAIHAVTATEAVDVKGYGVTTPCVVVPNGFDPDEISPLPDRQATRMEQGIADTETVFLYLSRLHPKKGLERLLEAMARMSGDHSARLVVGGSDRGTGYADKLQRLAADLGVADRVEFRGELRGAAKKAAFAIADAFVLASSSEGLPLAVLEAMAAGLPVVITEACNVPEVADAGAGVVIRPDSDELAAAMSRCVQDEGFRKSAGERAKELATGQFTWERAGRDLAQVYGNLVEGRAPGEGLG